MSDQDQPDFAPEEGEDAPELGDVASASPVRQFRARSRADDVIDAIAGAPVVHPDTACCGKCGSPRLRMIRPFGAGVVERKCLACGLTVPWASVGLGRPASSLPAGGVPGPFAGEVAPAPDPFAPTYRNKGRPRS
jgi:hypothetical protein